MDMYKEMQKINSIAGYLMVLVLLLNLATPVYADAVVTTTPSTTLSGGAGLQSAMKQLCNTARTFLGIGAMLLVVIAAVIYAVGQVLGAETRARASVWATAMLTGAVIGLIIFLLVPSIVAVIMGSGSGSIKIPGDPCSWE
jgi:hypothetical protein